MLFLLSSPVLAAITEEGTSEGSSIFPDESLILSIDRALVPSIGSPRAELFSDITFMATIGIPLVPLYSFIKDQASTDLSIPIIYASSYLGLYELIEWIKDLSLRQRPGVDGGWADISDPDSYGSFPSRHTAIGFHSAMMMTLLHGIIGAGLPDYRTWEMAVWLGAGVTGVLRVVAGEHYPTDVLFGALIGVLSGTLTSLLLMNLHTPN